MVARPGYPEVTDPDVLGYLEAENAWFAARMGDRQPLMDKLFTEMRGRIKEADRSVPQKDGAYLYWVEYEEGAEYKKWWRRPVEGGADELVLDETALAEGKDYFRLGALSVSNDGKRLAWSIDDNGSERFTARIKVIATGEILPDVIPDTLSGLVWTSDDSALVYARVNGQWRTDTLLVHRIGTPVEEDTVLFHEADEGFRVGVGLSASERWLVIATGDHETSEVHLVPAADPTATPILVRARRDRIRRRCARPWRRQRAGALYPHQRHAREFPPRDGRIVLARAMDHADRGQRCLLPDRVRPLPRFLCHRRSRARARSHRSALLRRSRPDRGDRLPEESYEAALADNRNG
jgi:protease II